MAFNLPDLVRDLRAALGEEHPHIWSLVTLGGLVENLRKLRAAADDDEADVREIIRDLCAFYEIEATETPTLRGSVGVRR